MGHTTWHGHIEWCSERCTFHGVAPQVVVSVRNPYSYWRSLFTYAWVGIGSNLAIPDGVSTFGGFVQWADEQARATDNDMFALSMSFALLLACGRPCRYDYVLHTETLSSDWLHLLTTLELPLVALPHSNPTQLQSRPPPPTVFTNEVRAVIHRLERSVFDEFGYERRMRTFELNSSHVS